MRRWLVIAALCLLGCARQYDVVVIGGGAGGTAAAIEAARDGASVLVVEQTPWLGGMLTTVIALLIIDKVGRKQLVWWGVGGMILCLVCIGLYFLPSTNLPTTFMLVFFLLYVFCTAISISAVVFVLLSGMYPNRVRGLAMSIAGFALWIGTYLIGQLTPWMLENLTPAGTFFLIAFMCFPYLWIMYRHVPNTTGKTLEEIEDYWAQK